MAMYYYDGKELLVEQINALFDYSYQKINSEKELYKYHEDLLELDKIKSTFEEYKNLFIKDVDARLYFNNLKCKSSNSFSTIRINNDQLLKLVFSKPQDKITIYAKLKQNIGKKHVFNQKRKYTSLYVTNIGKIIKIISTKLINYNTISLDCVIEK